VIPRATVTRPFVRLSAQAAHVGGLLRVAASYLPARIRYNLERQSPYFTVD
jgi:hypothetical protein